jgi:hypothetical protein
MNKLALTIASTLLLYATSASGNTGDELEAVARGNICPANLTQYALPDYASAGCDEFTHGDNYDVIKANECMNEVDHEQLQIIRYNSFVQRCAADHASQAKGLSRDLLNKTASGVPGVAGTNAMRMANLAAEQGWVSPSKAALIQSAIKAYKTTDFMSNLYKLYDRNQSLQEKLKTLAGLVPDMAFGKNLLAQEMLKTAIAGLTATSQTALDSLIDELDAFSSEIRRDNEAAASRAIEQAKAEAARLSRQRRLAAERANASPPRVQTPVVRPSSEPRMPAQFSPPVRHCKYNEGFCERECPKPGFGEMANILEGATTLSDCFRVCYLNNECSP